MANAVNAATRVDPEPQEAVLPVMTPREIVSELDRYIIGQAKAKRAMAIALRNRWRRQQVPPELRDEIAPKNILMIGPTGVGKTEIARRLARLAQAPFVKVEASKFTEVGYVGRDVESMVRDVTELSVNMVKQEAKERIQVKAQAQAEERILDLLLPPPPSRAGFGQTDGHDTNDPTQQPGQATREKMRRMLRQGKLDEREVEIELTRPASPFIEVMAPQGMEDMENQLKEMFSNIMPQEDQKAAPQGARGGRAVGPGRGRQAGRYGRGGSRGDPSGRANRHYFHRRNRQDRRPRPRPGPGRLASGRAARPPAPGRGLHSQHQIRHGPHRPRVVCRLGAFHTAKPSDLIPEFQGRFPIRVELDALDRHDFIRILTEPRNALLTQYSALLATENVTLAFVADAVEEIARIAAIVNERTENIGARRLHTVVERLVEDLSFDAPELDGQEVTINAQVVRDKLEEIVKDEDLSRYIL